MLQRVCRDEARQQTSITVVWSANSADDETEEGHFFFQKEGLETGDTGVAASQSMQLPLRWS